MTRSEYRESFAVFILSHGRADEIKTVKMLKDSGYTGDWYVVIDNEDDQADQYFSKFGERVIQFDKKAVADETDTGDTDNDRRVGVFARNKIQDLAEERGYKYHLQLDDDFTRIDFRYVEDDRLVTKACRDLDTLFYYLVRYIDKTDIAWLSFALSSEYLGGIRGKKYFMGLNPKTMGSFLMRADKKVKFRMRMNDDITTTIDEASRGLLMYSVMYLQVQTPPTQHMRGGMTEIPYTRVIEHKHFVFDTESPKTVLTIEYPDIWERGKEPFYSVNNAESEALYQKYRSRAEKDGLIVCGRLGDYRYYDMSETIESVLALSTRCLHGEDC